MKTVLTLTLNPCIDMSSQVEEVLSEEKLRCSNLQYDPGGGGINVSRVIKELGGSTIAIYCSGGPSGKILEELLERDLLERKLIKIKGWTRQNSTFFEKKSGQQFRFSMPGPQLEESQWRECLDFILKFKPTPSYLVVSGSLPPGFPIRFITELAKKLRDSETRLIIDTSVDVLQDVSRDDVYLFKPNLREFTDLLNQNEIDDHDLENSCKDFIKKGFCETLILSLGQKGAILATSTEVTRINAPKVTPRSKVGAGDSMVGGTIFGLANNYSLLDSATLGVAAGSAAVLTEATGLCRKEDVWKFYKELKRKCNER